MPRPPEQAPQPEVAPFPFLLASLFDSRETCEAPYDTIQAIVREQEVAEFSVFRLIQNWPESLSKAPPSPKRWYVAVIGHSPLEPLLTKVIEAINQGEPVPLPDEVVSVLAAKRAQQHKLVQNNFLWQFVLYIGAKTGRIPAHDNTIWIGTENDYFHHATRPPGTSLRIAHRHLRQTGMGSGLRPAGRPRRHHPFTTYLR